MKTDLILQRSTFSTNSSSTILNRLSTGSISLVRKTIFLVCIGFFGFNSWGQIAQRGTATTATSTTTSVTVTKPTGLAVGDVLIATINQADNDDNSLSNATLTGWQLIGGAKFYTSGNNEWWGTVLYKVATASDVSASTFTFVGDGDANDMQASIIAFSGVDQTNPIDIAGTYTSSSTNNTSLTASTISTTINNAAVIMLAMISDNQTFNSGWVATSPTSLTELFDLPFDADLDMGIAGAWAIKPSAGATGDGSVTLSENARDGAILIALRAAGSSGFQTFTSNSNFNVPCYVSTVTVEAWGGGGRGGSRGAKKPGGGGGGGAYVKKNSEPVTPGGTVSVTIGNGGTSNASPSSSTFNTITANPGSNADERNGGAGGTVGTSGDINFAGGNGGTAQDSNDDGGGGGGAAGNGSGNGSAGSANSGSTGGAGGIGVLGAGSGGAGGNNNNNGVNGTQPGGGGGGEGGDNNTRGNGGAGRVIVSWACPSATIAYSASSFCKSVISAAVTLTGTDARSTCSNTFSSTTGLSLNTTTGAINPSLSTAGNYTVTYSLPAAGGCNAVSATASITITQPTTEITIDNATIGDATIGDGDYLWNGNINSNGNVSGNWYVLNNGVYSIPNQVPQETHEVFVIKATAGSCISTDLTVPVAGSFSAQNIHIGPDANVTFGNNASFEVRGNFVNNGNMSAGSGAVNFTGGAAIQTISGTGALNFSNVSINKTFGEVRLGNNISISGALDFQQGNLDLNGKTLNYSGGIGISTSNGGLIGNVAQSKLNLTTSSQITDGLFQNGEIYDLTIGDNAGVSSSGSYTILHSLTVGNGATFTKEDGSTIIFKGDVVNDGSIIDGTSGILGGSFTFNNTNEQTISGQPLSVTNLEVSKTLGKLIVSVPITITGKFDVNGIIDNSTNLITLGSSDGPGTLVHTGGRITGALRRYFANSTGTDYYFPIGNTTSTRGVTINMSQSPGSNDEYITAQYKAGTPQINNATLYDGLPLTTADGQLIQNYDEEGYWQIDPKQYDAGIDTKNYTISLQMNNISGVNDYTKTRIIKADGPFHVVWSALTHVGATGSNENFTLTASGNGFSWFNGGGDNNNNPLPVELISFNGTCNEGMVNLLWQTASEFNSSHFDLEKSTDGETWRVLATIPSAGTSNELLTYQTVDNNGTNGANYYRLRQVDIDGKEKLYDPINVSCVETTAGYFTSYPNPSGNEFQVVVNNKEILGACTLNIVDVHGKVIDQRSIDMKDGINMFVINETLNPGIYFLNITNGIKSTQVIKHAVK
ncbi:MAG: T9SS type A sorting domain-containing protein [Crocinitomicaceae bacterium]|nr:T9SS type A sorting domain-containing protein [Crocinitomicaceae bacterium]MCF8410481.1 T9SS type A sorting domain-containing protein [Crocinitomicaceae bacterium]